MSRNLSFYIPLPPLSINNAYTNNPHANGRRLKKTTTRDWEKCFYLELAKRKYRQKIYDFYFSYDISLHYIKIEHYYFFPWAKIFNKNKAIKKRRNDYCNLPKLPNDIICKALSLDDAIFFTGIGRKLISQTGRHYMGFTLEIRPLVEIYDQSKNFDLIFRELI